MSDKPGRYERSVSGLLGAILVTVLGVGGFVVFTGLFRDPAERTVPEIDYLPAVGDLQEAGAEVVYPADLPSGWRATEVRYEPGELPAFELNLYTPGDDFVGLRQRAAEVDDLLEDAGVDPATEDDPLSGVDGVADMWTAWSDPDGDSAYAAEVGGEVVLVYGAVPAAELADLLGRLTTEPVGPVARPSTGP